MRTKRKNKGFGLRYKRSDYIPTHWSAFYYRDWGRAKDDADKVVTGVIDILTRDNAPDSSFEILNVIVSNISENISLSEYICYIWQNESVEMIEEVTDSDDTIFRQFMRFRSNLIKK